MQGPLSIHAESSQDIPSASCDHTCSVPVADLPMQGPPSQPVVPQTSNSSIDQQPSSSSIQRHSDNVPDTQQGSKRSSQNQNKDQKKDDRFSDPKKDLVTFLGKKAEYELDIRKEEVRLREAEVANKTEELRILRIKTEAEVEEKKEELRILRIKSEAEAEERKQIQDLLISLVKKNH
ncbi:uncharacterized protein LOC119077630 [Bradysia coprophila]|uniref:uncharacterized protein LOC119077630 n=1 Tax=Bradysia coprophila TaxID=38358 RepID=UPI00187D7EC1|nr:uncharacterized protein LOC119077630 [Bradysia coprophila]